MSSLSITLDKPEAKFIESEAPKLHRGFSVPVSYNEPLRMFVPQGTAGQWEQMMRDDVEDLKQAVEEYQKTNSNQQDRTINLEKNTWADVFSQMTLAQIEDDEKDEKGLGKCRALWRRFGDKVRMKDIDPWLNLIPNDYGLCVVRGAIVLVLIAAKRNAEEHRKLREAMVQIMQTVAAVRPKSAIFGRNPSLDTAVRKLYVAVLESVSIIVRFLRERNEKSQLTRIGDKLRKQGDSQSADIKKIDHALETVRIKAKEFERLYDNLRDQLLRETYELQYDTNGRMRQMDATASQTYLLTQSTNEQVSGLAERMERLEKHHSEAREAERQRDEMLLEERKRGVQAINGLLQLLEAQAAQFITGTQEHRSRGEFLAPNGNRQALIRSTTPKPTRPLLFVTADELSQILRIPYRMANDDLHRAIMERSWFRNGAAESLLDYTKFQDWLVGAGSRVLLIDGTDTDHAHDAVSAMSILTVDIMSSLMSASRQGQIAVLHFFCGLRSDVTEGPTLMLRSLVFQIMAILQRYRCLSLEFIDNQALVTDLQNQNFAALLYTFQQLCRQLPQYLTVYCFIDGISSYEGRSYVVPFYDRMVDFLRGITQTILDSGTAASAFVNSYQGYGMSGPRFNLKVLFTSAAGTIFDQYITSRIALPESDLSSGLPSEAIVEDISTYIGDARGL